MDQIINIALGLGIVALLGWSAWDWVKDKIPSQRGFWPPVPVPRSDNTQDKHSERMDAISQAERFRAYCLANKYSRSASLTGEAIAALYTPQEAQDG